MDSHITKVIENHYEYITWKANKKNPSGNAKPRTIKALTLYENEALLYDKEVLQYGVLEVVDEDGDETIFLFVMTEI